MRGVAPLNLLDAGWRALNADLIEVLVLESFKLLFGDLGDLYDLLLFLLLLV